MPVYKIRYGLYRIEAVSAYEAKKKVIDLMKSKPDYFITIEPDSPSKKRGILGTLIWG